jgi:hypothetical protein
MKSFGLGGLIVGAASVAVLGGCSVRALPVGPSLNAASVRGAAQSAASQRGDLLYVANQSAKDGVNVLTFPAGTIVTTISKIGQPRGICSDPHGSVWVTVVRPGPHPNDIYKFAHGGTKPIGSINARKDVYGCAVDPATGDLAVISFHIHSAGEIDIWPPKGKLVVIPIKFSAVALAYDDRGNLFIDGVDTNGKRALMELPKGSKDLTAVNLGRLPTWNPGSVQWDGKYIDVGIGSSLKHSFIVRVQVSSSGGKVVGSVQLQDLARWPTFAIDDDHIAATKRHQLGVTQVGLYKYPAGGKQLDILSGFYDPVGMAISVSK